jgi:hypothetical protein
LLPFQVPPLNNTSSQQPSFPPHQFARDRRSHHKPSHIPIAGRARRAHNTAAPHRTRHAFNQSNKDAGPPRRGVRRELRIGTRRGGRAGLFGPQCLGQAAPRARARPRRQQQQQQEPPGCCPAQARRPPLALAAPGRARGARRSAAGHLDRGMPARRALAGACFLFVANLVRGEGRESWEEAGIRPLPRRRRPARAHAPRLLSAILLVSGPFTLFQTPPSHIPHPTPHNIPL